MPRIYSYPWHDDQCERHNEYFDRKSGCKRFFCLTHNQWAAELPTRTVTVWHYGDGTSQTQEIVHKAPTK